MKDTVCGCLNYRDVRRACDYSKPHNTKKNVGNSWHATVVFTMQLVSRNQQIDRQHAEEYLQPHPQLLLKATELKSRALSAHSTTVAVK